MRQLDGKIAIITGGSRGIGRAVALDMAEAGASIVVVARDKNRLEETCERIKANGGSAIAVSCNLSNENEISNVVQSTIKQYGKIDILANIGHSDIIEQPLETMEVSDVIHSFQTGPIASMLLMQECFPYLKESAGTIINVSSIYAQFGGKGYVEHGMAKSAIEALTHMAAVEWGPHSIRTNCVRPIALTAEVTEDKKTQINASYKDKIPLGYLAMPEDIAPLFVYLASNASRYLNGAIIDSDGGLSQCYLGS